MEKPLTIKQLIDKLNLVMREFDVSENDYVFFTPVGEDEGDVSALTPVHNICGGTIKFHEWDKNELKKIINNRGIDLCFVSTDINKL
jgi:hypothetical protein